MENTIIEKSFKYNLPDDYLHQTSKLNKIGTWVYRGPSKLWIFADEKTGKIIGRFHYTERDNGADVPTPEGQIKILVDAEKNPLVASMIHNETDYATLPQHNETLPDGSVYGRPASMPPDHTYELTEVVYDKKTASFAEPFPWKQPHMTWEELKKARLSCLVASDMKVARCTDPDLKKQWEDYRQVMRNLPETFAGIDPWKVPFPADPPEPGTISQ